jgi:hypothetical protein
VSDSSPINILKEKVIPKATVNLFENRNRKNSSDDENPYQGNI